MKLKTVGLGALFCSVLALAACGGAKDADYVGPPFATLKGEIKEAPDVTIQGKIRLGLAWFDLSSGNAVGSISEPLDVQAQFPFQYAFDVRDLPPPAAVYTVKGSNGVHNAIAALVVYEDVDGNGVLDSVPAGSKPVDRILGSSMDEGTQADDGNPQYLVAYSDSDTGNDFPAMHKGFTILRLDGETMSGQADVSRVDSIPITLTGSVWLNTLVCKISDNPSPVDFDRCLCTSPDALFVDATLSSMDEGGSAHVTVGDCDGPVNGAAVVTLDGVPLSYDSGAGAYVLTESQRSVLQIGSNEIQATLADHAPAKIQATLGSVTVTAPAAGSTATAGAPLDLAWNATGNAFAYEVFFTDGNATFGDRTSATTDRVPGEVVGVGQASVTVTMQTPGTYDSAGSRVRTSVSGTASVDVTSERIRFSTTDMRTFTLQ